jgi:protein-tyrosine phosphatase
MDKLFWIVPGRLAGRPGPDEEPWDLQAFHQAGIGAILSVNDGRLCNPREMAKFDIAYACYSLSDSAPPQPGDAEKCLGILPSTYEFIETQLGQERTVMVHCSGGNDRTGLCLGYFLMRHRGLSPDQALHTLRAARPTALSAKGWESFALQIWMKSAKSNQY